MRSTVCRAGRIGGVIVRGFVSSAVDRVSGPGQVQSKIITLVFIASPLSTWRCDENAKTGWFGIMIMCPTGATCLRSDCYFSDVAQ